MGHIHVPRLLDSEHYSTKFQEDFMRGDRQVALPVADLYAVRPRSNSASTTPSSSVSENSDTRGSSSLNAVIT